MRVVPILMDDTTGLIGNFIEDEGVWLFETVGE